ncbi:cbb3-type cytochrome c oxidase N-terminal domain-containing protein [Winogradskyella sp. 3972H.M.0a.05]|uniref:cbb3-type cytochrome c oxidase N-terminal domain-containing protein n=1 Tax=Winogradskyella sp. 3972H.M.0a.05 TaxID=2950277 RepID=UPI003395C6A4
MRHKIPSWIRVPVVFFTIAGLTEYFIDSGEKLAFIEQPTVLLFLILVLCILIAIEAIVSGMENVLFQSLDEDAKARFIAEREKPLKLWLWVKSTYKKLLKAKPIEEEHEIILDHNYDGIRELDNALPPWWLYGFYATIIFGFVYMAKYHIFNGENQYEELEIEYAEAKIAIEEYKKTAKDLVDFNTVELLTDAGDLSAGKKIFDINCIACHKADGGGGIGPNLTDEYWILGGGIKNIFKTISEGGRDGKGMIAWKQNLKPSEIAQVASYLLQFQGTTPAEPKAPEGDIIWTPESDKDTEGEVTEEQVTEDDVNTIETDSTSVNN